MELQVGKLSAGDFVHVCAMSVVCENADDHHHDKIDEHDVNDNDNSDDDNGDGDDGSDKN